MSLKRLAVTEVCKPECIKSGDDGPETASHRKRRLMTTATTYDYALAGEAFQAQFCVVFEQLLNHS